MVRPHVTFVFGSDSVSERALTEVTRVVAEKVRRFRLCFSEWLAVVDPLDGLHRVFLLPSIGRHSAATIYHTIHDGPLASERRFGTDFEPHLTIATTDDISIAQAAREKAKEIQLPNRGHRRRLDRR